MVMEKYAIKPRGESRKEQSIVDSPRIMIHISVDCGQMAVDLPPLHKPFRKHFVIHFCAVHQNSNTVYSCGNPGSEQKARDE